MTTDKQKLADKIELASSINLAEYDAVQGHMVDALNNEEVALILAALRAPSSPDLRIDAPAAPEPAQSCPSCGGSGLYGDAAMRAISGDIPDETRDVRWAVNVLLETIAKQFEAWDTMDLWRSQAAETVRSHKHNFVTPPASSDAQHDAQLEGLAIGLEQRGEKSAAHLIRLAIKRLAQSVATSVAIKGEEPFILDYDAAPEAGEAKPVAWQSDEQLATEIHLIAGCHEGSERTRKIIAWYRGKAAAPVSADAGLGVSREVIARIIAGPICDSTKAEHIIMKQGRYAFCTACGETVSKPTISMREALNKADAILALLQPLNSASGAQREVVNTLTDEERRDRAAVLAEAKARAAAGRL